VFHFGAISAQIFANLLSDRRLCTVPSNLERDHEKLRKFIAFLNKNRKDSTWQHSGVSQSIFVFANYCQFFVDSKLPNIFIPMQRVLWFQSEKKICIH